jgi:hypothetical protein
MDGSGITGAEVVALEMELQASGLALRVERLGARLPEGEGWALMTAADIRRLAVNRSDRLPVTRLA